MKKCNFNLFIKFQTSFKELQTICLLEQLQTSGKPL